MPESVPTLVTGELLVKSNVLPLLVEKGNSLQLQMREKEDNRVTKSLLEKKSLATVRASRVMRYFPTPYFPLMTLRRNPSLLRVATVSYIRLLYAPSSLYMETWSDYGQTPDIIPCFASRWKIIEIVSSVIRCR